MKPIRLMVSIGLALCASGAGFQARAGCFGIHLCVPFVSFGIGLGLGAACAAPGYYACAAPVYTCSTPYYGCARPVCANYACAAPAYDPPEPAVASYEPVEKPVPIWVPSTPGPGHWVPDPTPYSYIPARSAQHPMPPTITVTKSAGGVPVYVINGQR